MTICFQCSGSGQMPCLNSSCRHGQVVNLDGTVGICGMCGGRGTMRCNNCHNGVLPPGPGPVPPVIGPLPFDPNIQKVRKAAIGVVVVVALLFFVIKMVLPAFWLYLLLNR
jgi:hypothetical protein